MDFTLGARTRGVMFALWTDMEAELQELKRKNLYLDAENKQVFEEVEQLKKQLNQFKSVCESQKTALADKDELLDQYKQLNESLQNDIKTLRELRNKTPASSGGESTLLSDGGHSSAGSGVGTRVSGHEPEQYRKLFVGGLNYDTDEDTLRSYFEQYGEVASSFIMKDQKKQSRGFGFIIYKDSSSVDAAQNARPHVVDQRTVDSKRAIPRGETEQPENSARTKKLFIGGMRKDTEESHLYDYFNQYGQVESVEMLTYKDTGRRRGFAFVVFDDYDPVDKLVMIKHHVINGGRCEVKKAVPRDVMYRDKWGSGGSGPDFSMQGMFNPMMQMDGMNGPPMGGSGNGGNRSSPRDSGPSHGEGGPGGNSQQQQQQQFPPGPPGSGQDYAQGLSNMWANYYNYMAANAGPMRHNSNQQGRSMGPYGTNQSSSDNGNNSRM